VRALTVADDHTRWFSVDKAVKGETVSARVRGTNQRDLNAISRTADTSLERPVLEMPAWKDSS
jgi:hypothetical protein